MALRAMPTGVMWVIMWVQWIGFTNSLSLASSTHDSTSPAPTLGQNREGSSDPQACRYVVENRTVDLSLWRGVAVVGIALPPGGATVGGKSAPHRHSPDGTPILTESESSPSDPPSPSFNLSLCGNLTTRCIDELTKVKQPPGALYAMFGGEPAGRCWDVLARWGHLESVAATPPDRGHGITLGFSRPGDPHIDCKAVTVEVDVLCDHTAPAAPRDARLVGRQTVCDWSLELRTSNAAVCGGG
jgi:hypothetical protein